MQSLLAYAAFRELGGSSEKCKSPDLPKKCVQEISSGNRNGYPRAMLAFSLGKHK